ncbi:YppG family protein [Bacillus sp. M6-12]|uniref:YppG family protein n=1 Tax=Bacillus sp. M6-12 TaxID=2054166 RepID=UPI0035B536F9
MGPVRRRPVQQPTNFLSQFRTSDGSFDFIKIAGSAQEAMNMYNQVKPLVSPFIAPFITKFLKK